MKKLMILAAVLGILAMASMSFAQNIGLTFDEAGTQTVIDGRTDLVPNPDLFNFDSAIVWVIAFDTPSVFGYEYNLTSTDGTATVGTPVIWPAEGSDFATLTGDVRVGTGICFAAGDAQAGPDPTHIRLAKHQFTWFSPPAVDVTYCIHPSTASVNLSGATAPQYTECVSNPVSLPFGIANHSLDGITPEGCAAIVFEWMPDPNCSTCPDVPTNGQRDVVDAQQKSWGSLKSSF